MIRPSALIRVCCAAAVLAGPVGSVLAEGAATFPASQPAAASQPVGPIEPPHPGTPSSPEASTPAEPPAPASGRAGESRHVRICWQGGHSTEVEWLARAYQRLHPETQFIYLKRGQMIVESWLNGSTDLLPTIDRDADGLPWSNATAQFKRAFGRQPERITYAYYPVALFVHPSKPVKQVSLEQLRAFSTNPEATWKDLGCPEGGVVRLRGQTAVLAKLLNLAPGESVLATFQSERKPRPGRLADPVRDVADDPSCLLVESLSPMRAASGLRSLAIVDSQGSAVRPDELRAVGGGRYPLRIPLSLYVHPKASPAARAFAQWSTTPEAGKALVEGRNAMAGRWPEPGLPFYAHVSLADAATAADRKTQPPPPPPTVRFEEPIEGAVAILPAVKLSLYFQMAKPAVLATYEDALVTALESDGRLKLVDRAALARVLAERSLALVGGAESTKAVVTADVFVLLNVRTDSGRASLHVQAIHGATAAMLGDLRLPIDPADASRFDPPLGRQIASWWPGVLKRLKDVRTRAVWTVVDVYPGKEVQGEMTELAGRIEEGLESLLSENESIFPAARAPLGSTQQELLMWLMGLSRGPARFSPLADFLVEGRLGSSTSLELRVRQGNLHVLKEGAVTGGSPPELLDAARAWLASAMAEHRGRPDVRRRILQGETDDWARDQAKFEYALGQKLLVKCRKGIWIGGVPACRDTPEYRESLVHFHRAAQLDPTWEQAAYAALDRTQHIANAAPKGLNLPADPLEKVREYEQFLRTFPRSELRGAVKILSAYEWTSIVERSARPWRWDAPMDPKAAFDLWRQAQLRWLDDGMASSRKPGSHGWQVAWHLNKLQQFFRLVQPTTAQQDEVVREWARRYDGRAGVPRSGFIQVIVLAHRKEEAKFLALLRKLQQDLPDPKHPEWNAAFTVVHRACSSLFPVHREKDSLRLWRRGRRGPGDLPYPGYKPKAEGE